MTFRNDLTGNSYGDYTVIGYDYEKSINGRYLWLCKCKCGNVKSIDRSSLKQGKSKNCGCDRRHIPDIIGNVVGKLTVVSTSLVKDDIYHYTKCTCVCTCGSYIELKLSDFNKGDILCCKECYITDQFHKTKTSSYSTWEAMKQRCLNPKSTNFWYYGGRGICICDKWLTFEGFYEDMGERPEGFTLDRINPEGDYCISNCRWADRKNQAYNTKIQSNNTSGKSGVSYCTRDKVWVVTIEDYYVGSFKDKEEAIQKRISKEFEVYGYNVP